MHRNSGSHQCDARPRPEHAGGSCLLIEPSGIKLQGASIRINSGGSPGNAEIPSLAKMLLPAALSAIQLATFKKKAPFCEECEKTGTSGN